MSELPEGTWLYVEERAGGWWTLLNVHEGQSVAVGRVVDGGVADFICERMNSPPPELAARRPDRELPFLCPCCGARGTTDGTASSVSGDLEQQPKDSDK